MIGRRTYEPLKFLGRFFWVPLPVAPKTKAVSFATTWEPDGEHRWAPTVVARIPLTKWAVGVGVWLNSGVGELESERLERLEVETEDAAYDAYVKVNGEVPREEWQAARRYIAAQGLDPDDEMEAMQALGVFS